MKSIAGSLTVFTENFLLSPVRPTKYPHERERQPRRRTVNRILTDPDRQTKLEDSAVEKDIQRAFDEGNRSGNFKSRGSATCSSLCGNDCPQHAARCSIST